MFGFMTHLRWILCASIPMCGLPARAQSNLSAEIWQQIMTQLPQPKTATPAWPRNCVANYKEFREARRMIFSSPAVEARYRVNSRDFTLALASWGAKYLQMPLDAKSDLCRDFPFVIAQLQQAAGDEPTGIFGERDAERLEKAIGFGAKIEASRVYAFGFQLGEVLNLPACPPGNLKDFPEICAVPADADEAHPARALEFDRITVSAPYHPARPGVPADGLVMIMFPKQARPDFLSDRRSGLFAIVANGRLEGAFGIVWPTFPMVAHFTQLYGKPTAERVGAGWDEKLVFSFQTSKGVAKIGCDPTGKRCDVAQVLTDAAPALLAGAMRNLRVPAADTRNPTARTPDNAGLRANREQVRKVLADMAEGSQRISDRARQEEQEQAEFLRRQNEQLRK